MRFRWSRSLSRDTGPTHPKYTPIGAHMGSISTDEDGSECAFSGAPGTISVMRSTAQEVIPAGPPQDRLWTEEDLAVFLGFRSISELINRHSNFPTPVPLLMQGRRWRPSDVISWVNHLCDIPGPTSPNEARAIPNFDITTINQLLEEALHVTTR